MTEEQWLACTEPYRMLDYLEGKATDRDLMLFSVACLRRIWHLLTDGRSRKVVEVTEQFVDGGASEEEACRAYDAFVAAHQSDELKDGAGGATREAVECVAHAGTGAAIQAASETAQAVGFVAARSLGIAPTDGWSPAGMETWISAEKAEGAAQAVLLRDILGNPYRPVALDPTHLTPEVRALAEAAYQERELPRGTLDPARLAVLADCLEEAGCRDDQILGHLRGAGPHVRGCFVVDLLLGRG
jgi:hypothetical protein